MNLLHRFLLSYFKYNCYMWTLILHNKKIQVSNLKNEIQSKTVLLFRKTLIVHKKHLFIIFFLHTSSSFTRAARICEIKYSFRAVLHIRFYWHTLDSEWRCVIGRWYGSVSWSPPVCVCMSSVGSTTFLLLWLNNLTFC